MKNPSLRLMVMVAVLMLTAIAISAQTPRVNVMPDGICNDAANVYTYYAWPGRTDLVVWGNVHDGTPPYTYTWDFGDGTPTVSGTVTNPKYINVTHVYATAGTKYATLTVTDAAMNTDHDMVTIDVMPHDSIADVNAAIEDGLRYLYLQQQPDGKWDEGAYDPTTTALAVLAFENKGHRPYNDFDDDIYAEYVKLGLDWLTAHLATQTLTVQAYGDPEEVVPGNEDANYIGIFPNDAHSGYQTGIVLMAIVASDTPDEVAPNGPAGVVGETYYDIAVDMVDWLAWAQNEAGGGYYRGGWRYGPNYSSSDNSVSQWPVIGLEAAETRWEINVPPFVKSELLGWVNRTQINGGTNDGCFYYTNYIPRDGIPATAAGICELAFCDVPSSDSRVQRALGYLERRWGSGYNKGFYYSMYGVAKGCRISVPDKIKFVGAINWYWDYALHLVATQQPSGNWPPNGWGNLKDDAFAILVLEPGLFGCVPVAVIDAPASAPPDEPVTFDGSGSHIYGDCPELDIAEWLWDFDADDGQDWNNPDAVGSITQHTFTLPIGVLADTFNVTLRVADNADSISHDEMTHTIIINFENHPPVADAGGPYAAKIGEPIFFDARGSYDPDSARGDYIASYEWDLDGNGDFADPILRTTDTCTYTWHTLYNGVVNLRVTDAFAEPATSTTDVRIWTSEVDVGVDSLAFSKPTPKPGDFITISTNVICDIESGPVSDVVVQFYDGNPGVVLNPISDEIVIPLMTAGAVMPISIPYTVGDSLPRHIYVKVDPDGLIMEFDEDNNEASKEIQLLTTDITPNPMHVILLQAIGDLTAVIQFSVEGVEHTPEDVNPAEFVVNGTLIPTSSQLLETAPGFAGKVWELTLPVRPFILSIDGGVWWDTELHPFTVDGQYDDATPFDISGDFIGIGHIRGDANGDGKVDMVDIYYITHYIYEDGPAPKPIATTGDFNADGKIDLLDMLDIIYYLYEAN